MAVFHYIPFARLFRGNKAAEFHGEDRYTIKENERPLRLLPLANLSPQSAYGNCDFVELLLLICRWQKRPCGTAASKHLVAIGAGLLCQWLLAVSFGPAGLGWRQISAS